MNVNTDNKTTKQVSTAFVIEGVSKTFQLPHERVDTLKESVLQFLHKKKYETFYALSNIHLTIPKGEFIGLVGKNGSGKSTLLKIMANIYAPDEGTVTVNGTVAPFLELGIGFQPELTARENIYVNAVLLGFNKAEIKERFHHIVHFAEIEQFLDMKVKNFSSGMKARLAFAIAKEAKADTYLCDEILAVGDESFQKKCLQVFREWKQQGKTIVLVSHNPSLILEFCTRAALVDKGKIIAQGVPSEIIEKYHAIA